MSLNDTTTKAEITYHGKKVYYLNEDLVTRIEPEQLRIAYNDATPRKVNILH